MQQKQRKVNKCEVVGNSIIVVERNRDRDMGYHEVNGGYDNGNLTHVHASWGGPASPG